MTSSSQSSVDKQPHHRRGTHGANHASQVAAPTGLGIAMRCSAARVDHTPHRRSEFGGPEDPGIPAR